MSQNSKSCMEKVAELKAWLAARLASSCPWDGLSSLPSRQDGTHYTGTNVLLLWMQQLAIGSTSPVWGTFKSFQQNGKPVRKGEKSLMALHFAYIEAKGDQTDPKTDGSAGEIVTEPESAADTQSRRIGILKPVTLFNEAQTEGYSTRGQALAENVDVNSNSRWASFRDDYLARWKLNPVNAKRVLSPLDEAFILRFSTDIMMIGCGQAKASDMPAYPAEAAEAIANASAGHLMKLAGISQEIVTAYNRKSLPTPAVNKNAVASKEVPAKSSAPAKAKPAPAETPAASPTTSTSPSPVLPKEQVSASIPVDLDW